jgi:predicted ATPase
VSKANDRKINPHASKAAVFSADLSNAKTYPKLIKGLKFDTFRHIDNLRVDFNSPITVISGTNRTGKTTILLSIACSHFEFKKRNYSNGKLERQTWSDVLKFTHHDIQSCDWTYHLHIKTGSKTEWKRGQRKSATKKWNGLGKKESQIKDVNVVYLDLDRILPARYYSDVLHKKALSSTPSLVSPGNQKLIESFLSYILEQNYAVKKLANHLDKDLLGFSASNNYSSYNSASGEDVLSRIVIECVEAPKNSLILIDEIELGLHPKVQRRLMDIIFEISDRDSKQFIITSHSPSIISCVPDSSRILIDQRSGSHSAICPISVNAALTKMDSACFPLVDLFCEDQVAEKIIRKALKELDDRKEPGLTSKLFNVIISGSASDTYENFSVRKRIYDQVQITSGHACILDGDMKNIKNKEGQLHYPPEPLLAFLPGSFPPERLLCDLYEASNNNTNLRYHIENSNVHCLFKKMVELEICNDTEEAFNLCWPHLLSDIASKHEFDRLVEFIISTGKHYSPDL